MRVRHVSCASLFALATAAALCAAPADSPTLFPRVVDIEAKAKPAPSVIKLSATTPVPAGGFADITIEAGKSASVKWRINPAPVQKAEGLPAHRLIFGGKPGQTYTVRALVVDFDAKTFDDPETEVTFAGTPIPPTPQPPGPGPNPPEPQPVGAVSSFVVVEDTLKAGPWRGEILGSPKVEAWYRGLQGQRSGSIHLLVDINAPTAAGKKWADLAAGKELPYLFILDSAGVVVKESKAPITSPDAFVAAFDLHTDVPRAMGLIMEAPKLQWVEFGSTPSTPIIPRAQWKPVKLSAFLPGVYDQDGVGQCASSACCTTFEMAARMAGKPVPKLSAGDLYSRVNGGRDRGSLLEDNLDEAMRNGIATAAKVPYIWNGRKANDAATVAERARYKVVEAYWCKDFDGMASAIQQGFAVETGLMWPGNAKVDSSGWLRGSGSSGGHALNVFGLAQAADGTWGVHCRNSWTESFGLGGNCIIPESMFKGQIGGFFAVRVVTSGEPVSRLTNPFDLREFALAW